MIKKKNCIVMAELRRAERIEKFALIVTSCNYVNIVQKTLRK